MPEMSSEKPRSFLELAALHSEIRSLFLKFQEVLLTGDMDAARRSLDVFCTVLKNHMVGEEEILLPVFSRAGKVEGCSEEILRFEHKRMREFVERFKIVMSVLQSSDYAQIIGLFDDGAAFKQLLEHHDLREKNALYPALDSVTTPEEKRDLLTRCAEYESK